MSPSPKTLSTLEQHQLLKALECETGTVLQHFHAFRNRVICLLMLDAGLRVGEVVKLKMSDLFFNGSPVENLVIPASISKNKTERTIPLSSRLKEAAQVLINYYPDLDCEPVDGPVFKKGERRLTTRQLQRIISDAGERAFGRTIHPHILRHTFATKLMRVTDMRTVQELLGHKHLTSTQVYTHSNSDDKKKAIDKIIGEELAEKSQIY